LAFCSSKGQQAASLVVESIQNLKSKIKNPNVRILLINPFYPISETPSPPLGIAFLAAVLERADITVKVLDFVVYPYSREQLQSELAGFSPDIVGATSVTMTFDHAIGIIQDVKSLNPDALTVMGGPHVSFCAEATLRQFPELDMVVLGEGEETIVSLTRAIEKRSPLSEIPGIVYRNGSDIVSTGFPSQALDVDRLPTPARHLLPLGRYRALGMAISMTTSRGCPFKCIFCVGRKMVGGKVRYRNPALVADEFEALSRLGFPQINIADDLFTASPRHCIAVCEEILRRGIEAQWTAFARVDTVTKPALAKMREAGCHTVSFGVESANAEILKTVKKGITTDQVIRAVELCNEVGMAPHASFILGLPGETPETLKESIDFGEKLKAMGVSHGFHLLAPFPGTAVREECRSYGIRIMTDDWSQYHANRAIVETPHVSQAMLDESVVDWEKAFDEWLDGIRLRMEAGEASEAEAWQLTNLERTVLIYDLMMGRAIETGGEWAAKEPPSSDETALDDLAGRIENTCKYTVAEIKDALENTIAQGNLGYTAEDGRIRWAWKDYLQTGRRP